MTDYAELHCLSNFSFLRGASHPEELVQQAHRLGYRALALTDECSLAGVVRAHKAAKPCGLKLIIGSEFQLDDDLKIVLLARNRRGYGQLCRLITRARRAANKGEYRIRQQDLQQNLDDCLSLLMLNPHSDKHLPWFARHFKQRGWLALGLWLGHDDPGCLKNAQDLSHRYALPLLAAGDVHMHKYQRRFLQDTLTAIRLNTPLRQLGMALYANGERYLRTCNELAKRYPVALLQETMRVADQCDFSLDCLRYEYPKELTPTGMDPTAYLRQLTEHGIRWRWPQGIEKKVRTQIEHELSLIAQLCYEPYFLTVYDIVRYAKSRNILCQGRGSAANSAVCYCLGITEVNPARMALLFERFISKERNEPPDIDVDFEHERREEILQYVYGKYGRDRAALTATVITYQARSAIRDVGKALGLQLAQADRLAKSVAWWDGREVAEQRLREAGFDPSTPVLQQCLSLVNQLLGFPRHLSQHVGGFVISRGPLCDMVPIENAAMPERTVIQWDKDDLDTLGLLKVDCLGLGMLTAIHRAQDLIHDFYGKTITVADIPAEDPKVYAMIQQADTIGVFQIESRAQMSMLPRLKPANFYDLVIEVAIVRPGPIQGKMVHPYLRRRQGLEPVCYPSEQVRHVLERTLGVPIFQEQVMQLAVVAAGFSPGEADRLRRAMAAWRRHGGLESFEQRLKQGMRERGYQEDFAARIYQQIQGFADYGFPESHAASFALLVYVSAWLKTYQPAAFTCALLNSQPMGFYAPAQLIQDARRHGVTVRAVDVCSSDWDCSLQADSQLSTPAIRLGLRMIKGLKRETADSIVDSRTQQSFKHFNDMVERARLPASQLHLLAAAGALNNLAGNRHQAYWQSLGYAPPLAILPNAPHRESLPSLPLPTEQDELFADYASTGLSLARHPLALLRRSLQQQAMHTANRIAGLKHGTHTQTAGLVLNRQRPGTAAGVTFVTLEDETGHINVVVWERVGERHRQALLNARLLGVEGHIEREGSVIHVIAHRLFDYSHLIQTLTTRSRDFH